VAILPELEDIPREYLKQQVGQQLALWEILFTGIIKGRDDLELIFLILRGDVEIPTRPLWDPAGIFISALVKTVQATDEATDMKPLLEAAGLTQEQVRRPSWFAVNFLGVDPNAAGRISDNKKLFNDFVRMAIAKRVFPNLRNRADEDVRAFITNVTARDLQYFSEIGANSARSIYSPARPASADTNALTEFFNSVWYGRAPAPPAVRPPAAGRGDDGGGVGGALGGGGDAGAR